MAMTAVRPPDVVVDAHDASVSELGHIDQGHAHLVDSPFTEGHIDGNRIEHAATNSGLGRVVERARHFEIVIGAKIHRLDQTVLTLPVKVVRRDVDDGLGAPIGVTPSA